MSFVFSFKKHCGKEYFVQYMYLLCSNKFKRGYWLLITIIPLDYRFLWNLLTSTCINNYTSNVKVSKYFLLVPLHRPYRQCSVSKYIGTGTINFWRVWNFLNLHRTFLLYFINKKIIITPSDSSNYWGAALKSKS